MLKSIRTASGVNQTHTTRSSLETKPNNCCVFLLSKKLNVKFPWKRWTMVRKFEWEIMRTPTCVQSRKVGHFKPCFHLHSAIPGQFEIMSWGNFESTHWPLCPHHNPRRAVVLSSNSRTMQCEDTSNQSLHTQHPEERRGRVIECFEIRIHDGATIVRIRRRGEKNSRHFWRSKMSNMWRIVSSGKTTYNKIVQRIACNDSRTCTVGSSSSGR